MTKRSTTKRKMQQISQKKLINNCIIYIRVSTDKQVTKGYSLEAQEAECKKFAYIEGLNILKIFREEGESAKTTKRTELNNLLKYCEENKSNIKYVLFWKLERFSRNLKDQLNVIDYLRSLEIEILSVTEPNECGAAGNLTRNILGALAQYDNELKSERVTNGMIQAFKSGRWLWRAPYGYIQNSEARNIVPKEREKDVVKNIFEKFATGCYSQSDLLKDLKQQQIKINANHLSSMLRNSIYCGIMKKEEWSDEPVKGTYPPIISEQLFNKVQDILDGRKPVITPHDFENPNFPLKQFLLCPNCGKPLTGSTSLGRNKKKFYYYTCYNKNCDKGFSMPKHVVEQRFLEVLKNLEPKTEVINLFKTMIKDIYNEKTNEIKMFNINLQNKLNKLTENKNLLVDYYLAGKIDEEIYKMKINDYIEQEKNIKAEIKNLIIPNNDFEKCLNISLSFIQNIEKAWQNSVLRIKKNLQKLIFPQGLRADFKSIQNTEQASIFKQIGTLTVPYNEMVLPRGFEPLPHP